MTPTDGPRSADLPSPAAPSVADEAALGTGAYVHLPFCARVCPYCDFAVVAGRDDVMDRYLDAVEAEVAADAPIGRLDAVFIGGGTPSRVPPPRIERLLAALAATHGLHPGAEITLEANPEDWDPGTAEAMVTAGVNRVSFGAQSTDPRVLAALGRRHGPREIGAALGHARAAGIGSVSVDLIFGHPVETEASWRRTLDEVVELGPDHVSTYALTVERGTELSRTVAAGAPAPDPDTQAARWEVAADVLATAGLIRYEVSNHARPGHPCRYNLGVWGRGAYAAYGLGAHGHRDGIRRRNVRSLDAYLERIEAGADPSAGTESVAGWDAEVERVFLGLRRTAGVVAGPAGTAFLAGPTGRGLLEAGVVGLDGDRLVVRRPLLTDAVAREVLGTPAPSRTTAVE
ncbi:MAG: radical SAM family heme chaperone HemW [Acidimicrobiia bacterium]